MLADCITLARMITAPYMSRRHLEALQLRKFRKLISHCYDNIPYYRKVMDELGLKPEDFRGLSDISKMPILHRDTLKKNTSEFCVRGTDLSRLKKITTGGSTGVPLTMHISKRYECFRDLLHTRCLILAGVNPFQRQIRFRPMQHIDKKHHLLQRCGMINVRQLSTQLDPAVIKETLLRLLPRIIFIYPSYLDVLLDSLSEDELSKLATRLRYIISRAEVLYEDTRRKAEQKLGAEVLDFYGCSEFGFLAFETREHNGLYLNEDCNIIEILDRDMPEMGSEKGELVVTSLDNYTMPLIRYNLMDKAEYSDDSSALCLRKVTKIMGRSDDFVILKDGTRIQPIPFIDALKNIPGLEKIKVVQESISRIVVYLVLSLNFDVSTRKAKKARLEELTKGQCSISFRIVKNIPYEKSGKYRRVMSLIHKRK